MFLFCNPLFVGIYRSYLFMSKWRHSSRVGVKITEENCPFGSRLHITWWRIIQIAFGTVILIPIKIVLLTVTLPFPLLLAATLNHFTAKGARDRLPSFPWQRRLIKLIVLIARLQLFIIGITVKVKGVSAAGSEAPIVVLAPHSTIIDGFFLFFHRSFSPSPMPSPISRKENLQMPIIGQLLSVCKPIYVSRGDLTSTRKTIDIITAHARAPETYPQIMIFPEGTNSNRKALLKFKPGAFIPGVPVQPVLLRFKMWDTITWTFDGSNILLLMYLTLCQIQIQMEVDYLPVYTPNADEKANALLFAQNVQNFMARNLRIPSTNLTYENGVLYDLAISLGLPKNTVLFDFYKLSKATHLGLREFRHRLREFAYLKSEESGKITAESLLKALFIPPHTKVATQFAKSLNLPTQTAELSFTDYALVWSSVVQPTISVFSKDNIFQCLNISCNERLTFEDFNKVLSEVFDDISEEEQKLFSATAWENLSNSKSSSVVSKAELVRTLEKHSLYIHLFNLVSSHPPVSIKEKLKNIIQ